MDGREYRVRKILQEKYEFSANRQASALIHLHFCLAIKVTTVKCYNFEAVFVLSLSHTYYIYFKKQSIMEANQDVSFRFDKATAKKPTGPQTKNSLRMHNSPKKV